MISKKTSNFITAIVIVGAGLIVSGVIVQAASKSDIVFPIAELGNCKSETDCHQYCEQRDSPDIIKACVAFAKRYNILPADEIARAEKFADISATGGPGGCKSEQKCVAYCGDISHIQECVAFAEKYGVISPQDLAQAKTIANALQAGLKFPGGCTSKASCTAYCENGDHIDECLVFADKTGVLPPKELAEAKRVAPFIKSGQTPGGCKSKAACETYCEDSSHNEDCVNFFEKAGFVNKEDADILRKTNGQRPGNCKSKEECQQFCSDPTNQQTCIDFAKKAGFLSPEESGYLDKFKDFSTCFEITSPEVRSCLVDSLGQDTIDLMKKGIIPMDLSLIAKFKTANKCVAKSPEQDIKNLPEEMKTCLSDKLGPDFLDKVGSMNVSCKDISPLKKAIDECTAEGKTGASQEIEKCLTLSCSNVQQCIERLSEKAHGQLNPSQTPDPKVQARLEECASQEINACVEKPCGEFFSCLGKLQDSQQKDEKQNKTNPAVEAKIKECTKNQQKGEQGGGGGSQQQQRGGREQQDNQQQRQNQEQQKQEQSPQQPSEQPSRGQQPQIDCSVFTSAPKCSDVGAEGSQGYNLCKQCFPDK